MATRKQEEMEEKQWNLVSVGEKKAEGWVKALVNLVLIQPLFYMSINSVFYLIKQSFWAEYLTVDIENQA